ncbi:purine permease 2-like [Hibiscus syriacus]|uniref:purine permease 2-like n=1 Tax=Hibiscus syriacus TaxID=106335 RepID=UPI001921AE5B|nr:purine permease 2-like [Hibiscus syriacus]
MTLGASTLYGFVLPAIELTYKKAKQTVTTFGHGDADGYVVFGYRFLFHRDGLPRRLQGNSKGGKRVSARTIDVLRGTRVECDVMADVLHGSRGSDFLGLSLLSGIIIAALLPGTESLAVLFYNEKFQVEKGTALVFSLWGSLNYLYGEFQETTTWKSKIKL